MPAGSGRYPSGQRGQTVNLLAYAFGGSNPPLPTIVATGVSTARTVGRAGRRAFRRAPLACGAGSALCGNSSAVERQPSKLGVAGSNPVSRSIVATAVSTARNVGGLFEIGVAPTGPTIGRGVIGPVVARSAGGARGFAVSRHVRFARSAEGGRSTDFTHSAHVAQLAEHALGKGEVSGSIPDMGSRYFSPTKRDAHGR